MIKTIRLGSEDSALLQQFVSISFGFCKEINKTMSKNVTATKIYRDSSKYPLRFDALHPGSLFRIDQERSRGLYKSNDSRIYVRSRDGFFAEELATGAGCCLMPNDMVRPVVQVNAR